MSDRRKGAQDRRVARRAPFVAAVRQSAADRVELAQAQDLGFSGIRLRRQGAEALAPSTPVSLSFELPDGGDLVHVEGEVVFERLEGGYRSSGVRFVSVRKLDQVRIARYLERLLMSS